MTSSKTILELRLTRAKVRFLDQICGIAAKFLIFISLWKHNEGANLDITTMAAAVKKLPEYTQTMTKLGQHVAIAQQCMNAFSKLGLLNLSLVEQIISTGFDEDGNEVY